MTTDASSGSPTSRGSSDGGERDSAIVDERFYIHWAWIAFFIGMALGVGIGIMV